MITIDELKAGLYKDPEALRVIRFDDISFVFQGDRRQAIAIKRLSEATSNIDLVKNISNCYLGVGKRSLMQSADHAFNHTLNEFVKSREIPYQWLNDFREVYPLWVEGQGLRIFVDSGLNLGYVDASEITLKLLEMFK